jgi:site-specific recombinase XerD
MQRRATSFPFSDQPDRATSSGVSLTLPELKQWASGWFLDCEISQQSEQTLINRRYLIEKLMWFHCEFEHTCCNAHTLRLFLHHAGKQLPPDTPRWGNTDPQYKSKTKPKAGTVATYHRMLSAFFNWIVIQEGLPASPMAKIATPIDRPDQITPFSHEQVKALLAAARRSFQPQRNVAIVLMLLDTGMRVSELCGLREGDVDMISQKARVDGKGGKERRLPFGKTTSRALWMYTRERERNEEEYIFLTEGGWKRGQGISRSGVEQMLRDLGVAANIENVRCSPHTFRHTFSIEFLRNGGNQFTLMEILGHTDIKMTARYVAIAQADMEAQHRRYSPVDRLKRAK